MARPRDEIDKRSTAIDDFWADVRIQPVEIALPSGVGYTLRAYRMSDDLPDYAAPETDADSEETGGDSLVTRIDDAEDAVVRKAVRDDRTDAADFDEVVAEDSGPSDVDDDTDEDLVIAEDADEEPVVEEVPVFLSRRGKVLLFRTPQGLVDFATSDAPHDLAGLEEWERVAAKLTVEEIVANADDSYELDLVVENLRGGHDAWDPELLISAGEVARDLGYALRLESLRQALSPGSPIDDLDESLRKATEGGVGAFFARRRVRKIGAEQAALAWRTIIGKISAATDWRD